MINNKCTEYYKMLQHKCTVKHAYTHTDLKKRNYSVMHCVLCNTNKKLFDALIFNSLIFNITYTTLICILPCNFIRLQCREQC